MGNKVALITGGSRGIGRMIAIILSKNGYDTVINYNGNKEKAEEVVRICKENNVNSYCVKANVANFHEVQEMTDNIIKNLGRIDVLINNAGITKDNLLLRMSKEDFDNVIDINLKGTFYTIKNVTRQMMKQKSGVIINMSSVVGITGNLGQSNYSASKAGVIGLTKSVAKELGSRGIRVNAIAPGFICTDMTDNLSDELRKDMSNNIPLKRLGEVRDVANLVLFLVSDSAKYITGQVISVDGGMAM